MARILTYNVHRCVGTDRRLDVARVAEVIAAQSPDIVALQELDVGRARTGGVDQAHRLAQGDTVTAECQRQRGVGSGWLVESSVDEQSVANC